MGPATAVSFLDLGIQGFIYMEVNSAVDDGQYDDRRYDDGRYDDGRYRDGRYGDPEYDDRNNRGDRGRHSSNIRFEVPQLTIYVDSRARPEDSRERNNRYDGYNGYNEGNGYPGECKW
jgi:hypothetical protein